MSTRARVTPVESNDSPEAARLRHEQVLDAGAEGPQLPDLRNS